MNDKDCSDAIVLTWQASQGTTTRRFTFEPHSNGTWTRIDELRCNGVWREVGNERVSRLDVEVPEDD